MLLQVTLNGPYSKANHPAVPVSARELAYDASTCVAEGARAVHIHPRDLYGFERLDPSVIDDVVGAVKTACGMPVGVSAGAWIEPDLDRRIEMIQSWRAPDYAAVDLGEPGAERIMKACLTAGVGIEAGVCSVEDVETLAKSGFGTLVMRVLIEPMEAPPGEALTLVTGIHAALDRHELRAPRLQHGDGEATWILLTDAIRRGLDTRIGLEDTLYGPDGNLTEGNAALVRAAVQHP
jgi:uncharacterized protein (DUF849 family)